MKTTSIAILVILVFVIGGAFLFSRQQGPAVPGIQDSGIPGSSVDGLNDTGGSGTSTDAVLTTVTYTADGFSPSTLNVRTGDTVRFVNESGGTMWVASAVHPIHAVYDGTSLSQHCATGATKSFDQCSAGDEYSFTFDKAGTWKYHDHTHASETGTIIVR